MIYKIVSIVNGTETSEETEATSSTKEYIIISLHQFAEFLRISQYSVHLYFILAVFLIARIHAYIKGAQIENFPINWDVRCAGSFICRDVRGKEREKTGTGKKLERTRFFPFPFLQILTSAHLYCQLCAPISLSSDTYFLFCFLLRIALFFVRL